MRAAPLVALILLLTFAASALAQVPPRRKKALVRWLERATYRQSYTPEPEVRPSIPAHGRLVRTWFNPVLVEDLRAGRTTFRKGAAMVKELYGDGTTEVLGWAVMRKLRGKAGRTGKGWYFYERTPGGQTFAGRGIGVCTSCHAAGIDYLLSGFRPD